MSAGSQAEGEFHVTRYCEKQQREREREGGREGEGERRAGKEQAFWTVSSSVAFVPCPVSRLHSSQMGTHPNLL